MAVATAVQRIGMPQVALTLPEAAAKLRCAGIEEAEREARLLRAHAADVVSGPAPAPEIATEATFAVLVERRARREPFALIIGRREFWGLSLAVSPATLIPRPESETLIEAALKAFPERQAVRRILDLGTGTGALLLALLAEFAGAFGVGTDRVPEASLLANANARALGLSGRARFLAGDWANMLAGRFDLVIANPPYIERAAIGTLMPEVSLYEPLSALDGGVDGLDAYRSIFPDLPRLLAPQGRAIVEIGFGAERAVIALARAAGLAVVGVSADLAGIPRALALTAPGGKKNRLAAEDGTVSLTVGMTPPAAADSEAPGRMIGSPCFAGVRRRRRWSVARKPIANRVPGSAIRAG